MAPTAAASAAADPEMPAKNMAETMVTAAMPPGSQPTRALAKSMIATADPPGFHDRAGEHEQRHGHEVKGIGAAEHPLHHHHQAKIPLNENSSTEATPMAMAMGVVMANSTRREISRISAVMAIPLNSSIKNEMP